MFEMQLVSPSHDSAIFLFEKENRSYFAMSISDRGDPYFEHFPDRHQDLMAEQEAGVGAYHVLIDDKGAVVGRFNLYKLSGSAAEVGYRVAERVSGRGLATCGLRTLCRIAREDYGLETLTAGTSNENVASQRVLLKAGFAYIAPAEVGGRPGALFGLEL